jgi:hypothetical protein
MRGLLVLKLWSGEDERQKSGTQTFSPSLSILPEENRMVF